MLNLSSLRTQSLASCVNYFVWNCLTCFSNTKIGSVTSFSILFNFQGPVCASAKWLTACLFYHRSDFLSSSFFEVFRFLSNLDRSLFLGADRNFRTSIGSFRFTSSWDSEVILLSQRLALKYNTIHRARCQHFFAGFFKFFQVFSSFSKIHLPAGSNSSAAAMAAASPLAKGRRRCYILYIYTL